MIFLCLAAGKGSRFGYLGSYMQKCMYPIVLKPFVQYTLDSLVDAGVFDPERDQFAFVVGHKAEQIRSYFGDEFRGMPIRYVEQGRALGTGHAVKTGFHALGGHRSGSSVVAWLGDSYISGDILRQLAAHARENAVTVAHHDDGEPYGHRVDLDEAAQRVTRVWHGSGAYLEVGGWKMTASTVDELDKGEQSANTEQTPEFRALATLQRLVESGLSLGYVRTPQWLHLGGTKPSPEYHLRKVFAVLAPDMVFSDEQAGTD